MIGKPNSITVFIDYSFKIIPSLKTSFNMLTSIDSFAFICMFLGKFRRLKDV